MEMVLPSAQSRLAPAGRAAPTAAAEASAPYAMAMVGASSASAESADGRSAGWCERADMVDLVVSRPGLLGGWRRW